MPSRAGISPANNPAKLERSMLRTYGWNKTNGEISRTACVRQASSE
jgi:hypothetical protein